METVDINNVPIFSTGIWEGRGSDEGGDNITPEYLDSLVDTFNKVGSKVKPRLRLTHNKTDSASATQMASLGWVQNLKRDGNTLITDFKSVPKKVADLIDKQAFGRFSPGIYPKLSLNGIEHKNVLDHVALLGSDLPANTDIDGLISLYGIDNEDNEDIKIYTNKIQEIDMENLEKQIAEMQTQIKEYDKKIDDLTDAHNTEKELLAKENEDLKSEIEKINYEKKVSEVDSILKEYVNGGKITPAQVDGFKALMLGETKEDDNDVKEYSSRMDIVKGIIDNEPDEKPVIDDEVGQPGETSKKTYTNAKEDEPEKDLDTEIKEYMKENDISDYGEAYNAVTFEKTYGGNE